MQVVERIVESPGRRPRHEEWVALLKELAKQVRNGSVCDRDLQAIGDASVAANNALAERLTAPQR